jgi:hypothetical protein
MATFDPGSAVFWKGVRCWQFASHLRPSAIGNAPTKAGASRRRGRVSGRSPSFLYNLAVQAWVPAIGGDHHGSKAGFSGTSYQTTKRIYLDATLEQFVNNSGRTAGLGQLAWVDDLDQSLNVTNTGPGGPGVAMAVTETGSWTPAVGDLVVMLNPSTGEGFVSPVLNYGAGNIGVNAQRYSYERDPTDGEPVLKQQGWTTAWIGYRVDYYYDKAEFVNMVDNGPPGRSEDRWSPAVQYQFRSESGITYPAAWVPDLT